MQRPEHKPEGNPCTKCGLPGVVHRIRSPRKQVSTEHKFQGETNTCTKCGLSPKRHRHRIRPQKQNRYTGECIGIDGEGQTDENGNHKYTLLAASNADGSHSWYIENKDGLSTRECLEFICSLPQSCRIFAYAFGYDLTKILEDCDNRTIYRLFRPNLRKKTIKGHKTNYPIYWPYETKEYSLNLLNTRFTVRKGTYGSKLTTINDIWKFYQGKFTSACENWKVGIEKDIEQMKVMKELRPKFDELSHERVREYCLEECRYMAQLAQKLIDAHESAGLTLTSFYGAGSSAAAMLKVMGIKDVISQQRKENPWPSEMQAAVMSAFFGGRFENSVIGPIHEPVYSWDISSAYPYQLYFLPCLLHGKWTKTRNLSEVRRATTGICRYELHSGRELSWGPFPFRLDNGSITFPSESGGGWVWKDEFLTGMKLFPNVEFKEAWIYNTDCDCHPFKRISEYYIYRTLIGKEGPGIVVKLGVNSCYGKLAQFIGGELGQFTNWVWAGMITSGCRSQLLEVLGLHSDKSNCLMMATDGICSTEKIILPLPKDTGTGHLEKPLGGWEQKILQSGLFLARPGIYFPLDLKKEGMKHARGRGVGRGAIFECYERIMSAFAKGKESVHIKNISRFIGAKSGIHIGGKPNFEYIRSEKYGKWITQPVDMSFDPMPKREGIIGNRLGLRNCRGLVSEAYKKETISDDIISLQIQQAILEEQPDMEWQEYDTTSIL